MLQALKAGVSAILNGDPKAMMAALDLLERALWVVARICLPLMFKRAQHGPSRASGAPLCDYFMCVSPPLLSLTPPPFFSFPLLFSPLSLLLPCPPACSPV